MSFSVLWLIQSYEVHAFDLLAEALRTHMSVDLIRLTAEEQQNLKTTLKRFDFSKYDRVMTTLRSKKEMHQWRVMRQIPNLIVFEYDACQNYIPGGKYEGRFSKYYRHLDNPLLIVSGAGLVEKLRSEGFDAHFLPKGYDPRLIQNEHKKRDVPIGFIGRLNRGAYEGRKAMLDRCVQRFGLQLLRTDPGEDYARALNRIKIFLTADIGLGEYMAKNFEAMAAGCVLATYDQGEVENSAVGFVDMQNVVLYRDEADLANRLQILSDNPGIADKIAREGAELARKQFAYDRLGDELATYLQRPLPPKSTEAKTSGKLKNKQPSILFVIPYFGQWPFWFDYFLQSCRYNPTINWLLIGDAGQPEDLPANVIYRQMSFESYLTFVSNRLGINFAPTHPYKLCDLKPLYGFLHEEDLADYDFWGFGDLDVIYGNLRSFLTGSLLMNDVISCHGTRISGHLALFRNILRLREAFLHIEDWDKRICNLNNQRFDEAAFSKLFIRHKNYPKWIRNLLPGSNPIGVKRFFKERFSTPNCRIPWEDGSRNFPSEWYWKSGILTNNASDNKFMYLHFLYWKQFFWKKDYRQRHGHLQSGDAEAFEVSPDCKFFRIDQKGFHVE